MQRKTLITAAALVAAVLGTAFGPARAATPAEQRAAAAKAELAAARKEMRAECDRTPGCVEQKARAAADKRIAKADKPAAK